MLRRPAFQTKTNCLAFPQECVVDTISQDQSDQRIVHASDPAIVRRAVTFRFVGQHLGGTQQKYRSSERPSLRKKLLHKPSSLVRINKKTIQRGALYSNCQVSRKGAWK